MATRRERVILELQDDLSSGMVKAAGATKLLQTQLRGLDGATVDTSRSTERSTKSTKEFSLAQAIAAEESARLRKNLRDQARALIDARDGTAALGRDTDRLGASTRKTSADINQLSGRLSLFLRGFAAVGPALAPLSTVAVAGVAGLASQFGFAATGAVSLVAAAQGVGDALKAVNEAALEPTAANLEKAREAMAKIGPDAQAFVTRFQEIRPVLNDIRDAAAAGWFPGLTESLTSLEQIAPEVASLFKDIGTVGGNLVAEGAAAFAGPGWTDFRNFVAAEAPKALDDLGRTLGNVAKGLAELWMAFGPLNSSFSSWMLDASRSFADWAEGLSQSEGFQEFVDYVRTNGPKVADAAVAIANAVLQIAEAAAPIGGPVLKAITAFADAIATIANSPLGTPIMAGVAAMSALSIATNVATAATLRLKAAQASLGMGGGKGMVGGGGAGTLALAGFVSGLTNGLSQIEKFQSGNQGLGESLLKLAPGFRELNILSEQFGVHIPGITNDVEELSTGTLAMGSAFEGLADKVNQTNEALAENARITLGAFSATTSYREALKKAQEQAANNNAGIKGNSEAALENRRSLESLAGAWQRQRDEMIAANRSTDEIAKKQAAARRAFIETATAMGVPIAQARRLAKELLGIPTNVKSTVTVDTGKSMNGVTALKRELAGIRDKTVTVTINGRRRNADVGTPGGIPGLFGGSADGSTVPKDGGPYADRYPYLLAPGEEVISNRFGQADRHRPLLKAINAGLLADGGTPGKSGKRRKNEVAFIGWDTVNQVPASLKGMIKSLEESRDAIKRERDERVALADSLTQSATGNFMTDLFGGTDVWSSGGTFLDAINRANGDTAGSLAYSQNLAKLTGMGLDGVGLETLLAQADAADLANLAATATPEIIKQYEEAVAARTSANAQLGAQIGASVNPGLAAMQAELVKLNAQVAQLNGIQKSIEKDGPKKTGHAVGKANNKGAGKGARNRNRSALG